MDLVDTHCHIQSIAAVTGLDVSAGEAGTRQLWAKDATITPDSVIAVAKAVGVSRMLVVGCDLPDSELAINFVKDRPECRASIGIHPHEAQHYANDTVKQQAFAELVASPKVVAIGECGLDFFYNHSPEADQVAILKFQIELALKHDLPMVFHVREAFDLFWPIFDSYPGIRGVLHSFTDSADNLAKAMDRGLYIGVNGIATFAKNPAQLAVYKAIPLDRLLLETDAPFLTPTPYRGSINEPKHVGVVADFLSALRSESRLEVCQSTTSNAQNLFDLT